MTKPDFHAFRTPGGEAMVVMSREALDRLVDRLDSAEAALAMAEIRAGRTETLSLDETKAFLAAPTPLAFWRAKREQSQASLSRQAGISPSYLSELESGRRKGSPAVLLRLAKALRVPMEALVDETDEDDTGSAPPHDPTSAG